KGLILTLKAALQIVHDRLTFQSYTAYPVICDISNIKSIEFDAREYLSVEGSTLLTVVALVTTHQTLYSMARFYVEVNTPKVPTQLFKNTEGAEAFIDAFNH